MVDAQAREHWRARLAAVEFAQVEAVLQSVPEPIMSVPTLRFCVDLLTLNQGRLLDGD